MYLTMRITRSPTASHHIRVEPVGEGDGIPRGAYVALLVGEVALFGDVHQAVLGIAGIGDIQLARLALIGEHVGQRSHVWHHVIVIMCLLW